jgi:hypothetical protein
MQELQEIEERQDERAASRVAAVDVAKASGVVSRGRRPERRSGECAGREERAGPA